MKKVVKAYAKLNIALNVLGSNNGYHDLDTVVSTVNKYNVIKAFSRKDDKIILTFSGKYAFTPSRQEETNAYKSAKLFIDTFKTKGANIEIIQNVPTGSGMGGSSVDIAGVLACLKKLYKIKGELKPLADSLGSDSGYLLKGGFARLKSRGEVVERIDSDVKLYFAVIYAKRGVNTKECFEKFDLLDKKSKSSDIDMVVKGIKESNFNCFDDNICNQLLEPATSLNNEVLENLEIAKSLSPKYYSMTGSGSTVFIMYENYEMASWAVDKLKREYNKDAELLYSVDNKKPKLLDAILDSVIYTD